MIPLGVLSSARAVFDGHVSYHSNSFSPSLSPKQASYVFQSVDIPAGMDLIVLVGFRNGNNTWMNSCTSSSGTTQELWAHRSWYSANAYRIVAPLTETIDITVTTDITVEMFNIWLYAIDPGLIVIDAFGLTNTASGVEVQTLAGGYAVALCNRGTESPAFVGVTKDDEVVYGGYVFASGSNLNTDSGNLVVNAPMNQNSIAVVSLTRPPEIAPGTAVFDSFTRRNNARYLGATDSGHLWKQNPAGVVGVSSGQAYRVSGTATASLDFGQQDMLVSAKYAANTQWFPTIRARCNADGSGGYAVSKQNASAVKLSGYGTDYPIVSGDRIGLRVAEGVGVTNVSLLINGEVKVTWADSAVGRPSGTHAAFSMGNDNNGRLDDFSVEAPA